VKIETWKRIESETVAECRVFNVRRDRSRNSVTEKEADFFVIENPDWVNVIPVTSDNEIVLIRQFRHGTESVTLEIPGGMVDEGEVPESCARRELLEETGYSAGKIVYLGKSHPNPAIQQNLIHHFAAFECERVAEPDPDEHESIETHIVAPDRIEGLISGEEISHSLVIAGFQRFQALIDSKTGNRYES